MHRVLDIIVPHDIIMVNKKAQSTQITSLSESGQRYWERSPYHVVRRAKWQHRNNMNWIPIGIRGDFREERFAVMIPIYWVERIITPISVMDHQQWLAWERSGLFVNMVDSLNILAAKLSTYPLGIGGSLGYELTSEVPVVKETSDIDLILYADKLEAKYLTVKQAEEIMMIASSCSALVDIQVQNIKGAFHLQEYVSNPLGPILLKTDSGPIFSKDIW